MYLLKKIIGNPSYYFSLLVSLARGTIYVGYYFLFARNIKIKFPFLVSGKLTILGPGRVEIGSKCLVMENVFKGLTIITFSKNSHVKIGNNCMLAGLTIRCKTSVEIGSHVMTARALIQDDLFVHHDEATARSSLYPVDAKQVAIGNNVWLGGHCIVLGGSHIGSDSVLAAYSVCSNDVIKEFSLINGNPVRKALPIEQLLKLRSAT